VGDRIAHALTLARLVAERPDPLAPLGVGELSRTLGLTLSTTSRLAAELERVGMLERAGGYGGYRIGPAAIRLSGRAAAPYAGAVRFALALAAQQTGETVCLAGPAGGTWRIVASVASAWTLHSPADVGGSADEAEGAIARAAADPAGGIRESARGRAVEVAAPVLTPDGECVAVLAVRLLVDRARGGVPRARRALAAARHELERSVADAGDREDAPPPAASQGVATGIPAALRVLDALVGGDATLPALARATGLGPDRVHRILRAARRAGLAAVDPAGRHRIPWGLHAWHRAVAEPLLIERGTPLVRATAEATGECAFLTVLRGMRSFTLVEELGPAGEGLRMASWIGRPHPIIGSDGGPALAHDLDPERLAELLPARHSAHEVAAFAERVRRVRRDGVISFASIEDAGLFSISAPVRDAAGSHVAAACLVGPVDALRPRARELEHATLSLASAASALLLFGE